MPVRITPAVKGLLIACVAIFFIQQTADQFFGQHLMETFGLVPSSFINGRAIWQLFTYSFLHADVMHLFLNLLMLAFIGGEIEAAWGTARFLRFYFACATVAGICYLLLNLWLWRDVPMVGASGAIYGLLMAYGLLFGERVLLFMMLFPMKARHFVWILAALEFTTSLFSGRAALASVAHLGGMAAGFALIWGRAAWTVYRRNAQASQSSPKRKRRKGDAKHLKLVFDRDRKRRGSDLPDSSDMDSSDDTPKTWH
ncbi:MAG: rhomboid family intramembrane serine protease [Oligoflexia bacterium]|nr:rhomboid family intramembrane serine protease [Oligoflexia bacterium]